MLDISVSPADRNLFGDKRSAELELCGCTVDYTYGLTCPAAHYLVHKGVFGECDILGCRGLGAGHGNEDKCYDATSLHKLRVLLWR